MMTVPKKEFVEGYSVWVGDDTPIDLKVRILAAIASYQMGIKSMDRTLKLYGENWTAQFEREGVVRLQ
ncbi:MAG: hypothetical protein HYT87_14890 [Nitrospirae bacterium]|nr:hypothetical protein [Nitrospirota bacterium]